MKKCFKRCLVGRTYVPVRVLAIAEGYAMVRRAGSVPFIKSVSELTDTIAPKTDEAATMTAPEFARTYQPGTKPKRVTAQGFLYYRVVSVDGYDYFWNDAGTVYEGWNRSADEDESR